MSNNIHLITTSSAASASSSSSASTSKANQPTTITIQPQQPSSSASGSNVMRKSVFLSKDGQRGTSQVPVRIVQAIPSNSEGGQVRKIIQLVKNDKGVPSTSYIKIPLTSPIKAAGKKMLEIPHRSKIVTNTKMKVAESIKIQKTTSVAGHNSTSFPSNTYTTPTKLVTVSASPSLVRKDTVAQQQQSSASNSPTNSFSSGSSMAVQNHLASPIRPKPSSSFLTSPPRNKRPAAMDQCQGTESKRRRTPTHGEKGGKGLRHFAMLVCEKVKQKVTTTYNEVADELVTDYAERQKYQQPDQQYDQKNIRRRVYDALNVLMAMNIIFKDKKDIHWVGLPTNSAQEVQALQSEKTRQEQRIQMKKTQLQELILQQIAFKNLVERNKRIQETQGAPPENSSIQLPFIIVNTSKKTVIDCSISNDKFEYLFNFNNTFEIHDDIEVLKRMGMAFGLDSGACTSDDLKKALNLVPDALKPYVEEMAGYTPQQGTSLSTVKSSGLQTTSSLPGLRQIIPKQEPMSDDCIQQRSAASSQADSLFRTIKPDPDPNDQEVAMVTTQLNNNSVVEPTASSSSSSMVVTSSASSGMSSRPHSAGMMSITPLSSSRSSAAEVGFDDDEEEDGETSVSSYNNQQPLVDSFVS